MKIITKKSDFIEKAENVGKNQKDSVYIWGGLLRALVEENFMRPSPAQREHHVKIADSVKLYKRDLGKLSPDENGFIWHVRALHMNYHSVEKKFNLMDGYGLASTLMYDDGHSDAREALDKILDTTVFEAVLYRDRSIAEEHYITAIFNGGKKYTANDIRNNILSGCPSWNIMKEICLDPQNAPILEMMSAPLPKKGDIVTIAPLHLTEVTYRALGALQKGNKDDDFVKAYEKLSSEEDRGRRTLTRIFNLMKAIGQYGYHLVSITDTEATHNFVGYFQMRNAKTSITKNQIKPKRHLMGCLIEALEKEFQGNEIEEINFLKNVATLPIKNVLTVKNEISKKYAGEHGIDFLGSSSSQMTFKHAYQVNYFTDLIHGLQML